MIPDSIKNHMVIDQSCIVCKESIDNTTSFCTGPKRIDTLSLAQYYLQNDFIVSMHLSLGNQMYPLAALYQMHFSSSIRKNEYHTFLQQFDDLYCQGFCEIIMNHCFHRNSFVDLDQEYRYRIGMYDAMTFLNQYKKLQKRNTLFCQTK